MANTALSACPVVDVQGDGRWHSMHKSQVDDCRLRKPNVLFVGDALIERMANTESWEKLMQPLNAVNAGIGGDSTQHVLWRLQNGLLHCCQPKVVVILVGTNNHANTSEEITEALESIAWCISQNQPSCKIIMIGLLPRGEKPNVLREKMYRINFALKEITPTIPNTYFLDADPGFVRSDGIIARETMNDYLHLTRHGYTRFCSNIVPLVKRLLSEH